MIHNRKITHNNKLPELPPCPYCKTVRWLHHINENNDGGFYTITCDCGAAQKAMPKKIVAGIEIPKKISPKCLARRWKAIIHLEKYFVTTE